MGQETSRFVETARTAAKKLTADFGGDSDGTELVLWEGVPDDVRWLVISHVKLLLTNDPEALCFRPDQLEPTDSPDHELDDHEAAAAAAALRDRGLGPLIQKAIDTLVPGSISEATFWEHFFCHVDVLKVKIVSDYLRAQELCADARKRKQEEWLSAFDRCDESLQMDLKRAAEHIAMDVYRATDAPGASEADSRRRAEEIALSEFGSAARWTPGTTEAWLDYTEDGPWEIARFLQKRLARRARESRESAAAAAAAAGGMPSAPAGTPVAALRMQRSFTPSAGSDLPTPASTATLTPEPMD